MSKYKVFKVEYTVKTEEITLEGWELGAVKVVDEVTQ